MDFSEDIASDDEESYFAEEGLTYLEEFWVELESSDDVEDFASALEELCLEYVESEEDFYFEYEETEEDDCIYAVSYTHLDVYKRQGLMPFKL